MIERILVPTDGSGYSNIALEYAIYIAKKLDSILIGLNVVDIRLMQAPVVCDISGAIGIPPCQEFVPVDETGLDLKAENILNTFAGRCRTMGVRNEIQKVVGIIDESIIEEGRKTDLILLAQRGEHLHLGGIGSTAESVLRKSGKPVIVTPATFKEIESMAIAYDGSLPADNALKMAAELSQSATWPLTIMIITDDQSLGEGLIKKAEALLESYSIDSDTVILNGDEDRAIIRFIKEGSVELMVMGAYGHNRLRELLLGSTTNYVIRKTTIPVLLHR
jgi:nucleotide-binding universal stress UspA family protein